MLLLFSFFCKYYKQKKDKETYSIPNTHTHTQLGISIYIDKSNILDFEEFIITGTYTNESKWTEHLNQETRQTVYPL